MQSKTINFLVILINNPKIAKINTTFLSCFFFAKDILRQNNICSYGSNI